LTLIVVNARRVTRQIVPVRVERLHHLAEDEDAPFRAPLERLAQNLLALSPRLECPSGCGDAREVPQTLKSNVVPR